MGKAGGSDMTAITPTYSVRIDPRHSTIWSRPEDAAEQARFSRLAEDGHDGLAKALIRGAAGQARLHIKNVAVERMMQNESPEWWDTRATAEELAETMTRRPTKLRTSMCE